MEAPVVCIPGFTGSPRQFSGLAALLAPRWRVLSADLAGHGQRPPWQAASRFTLADEAVAFEALFPPEGQVHLVAHSYGAAVALRMASAHRRRVRSMALYEPAIWGTLAAACPGAPATREIERIRDRTMRLLQAGDLDGAAECFIDYWAGPGRWASTTADRKAGLLSAVRSLPRAWHATFDDRCTEQELHELDMPCLLLTGQRSPPPARRALRLLAQALPSARVIDYPGLGHLGPMTDAGRIDAAIATFIAERSQPWVPSCPSRTA